jgi:hypothetical protein
MSKKSIEKIVRADLRDDLDTKSKACRLVSSSERHGAYPTTADYTLRSINHSRSLMALKAESRAK